MRKVPAKKQEREFEVLLGLIRLFLNTGKAVGSNTLRENGFAYISSATIRNYFASLETKGYLRQAHTSGGRVPTELAFRHYTNILLQENHHPPLPKDDQLFLESIINKDTKQISLYLQEITEAISEITSLTTLITAPRFDQDFISKIIVTKIDTSRSLCIIVTDFGFIHTESIYLPEGSKVTIKAMQKYFEYRLSSTEKPELSDEEEAFSKRTYNEIVLRHFISYSNMETPDIYKGGFSKLLMHNEFHDPTILSNTLSLFENSKSLQQLLFSSKEVKVHLGSDLKEYMNGPYKCAIMQCPYFIHNKFVGNIAILGPTRMNYKDLLALIHTVSDLLSKNLTKTLYKYQLKYRMATSKEVSFEKSDIPVIGPINKEKS